MNKEQEIYFCKEHNAVIMNVKKNGVLQGVECSEGFNHPDDDESYLGIAWILTWADLGIDEF